MIWKVARTPLRATFRLASRLNLVLNESKYRYIFILGHVRSGSTLLAHILASHPDFAGAGEMHISYRTEADLPKLVLKTCEFLRRPVLRKTYIVDQINHDYVADEVLLSERISSCVILLRNPEATLKSMMSLSVWQETEALALYINRLKRLTHYRLLLRERAFFLQYDDLVDRPDETLAALSGFLSLDHPLTANYKIHRMTGRVEGFGDPSTNIKTGHIIRTARHEITLSENTLITASQAFRRCQEQLQTVAA